MTVDEAIARMQTMINIYYAGCTACRTPGGYRIIRINPTTGHIEELGDAGDWQEPTGDYYTPPPVAREGGTTEDQICLAASNAVNVLMLAYENVTDSISSELDVEAALEALAALIIITAPLIAPSIIFAIGALFLAAFAAFYEFAKFASADVWDADFTKTLVCYFVDCAMNDAGVVTFDWECVQRKLGAAPNPFDITLEQIRLVGQLSYLVQVIGGVDALNQAGSTTAITSADCSDCAPLGWCYRWNFSVSDGGYVVGAQGTWVSGLGWQSQTVAPGVYDILIYAECGGGCGQPATRVTLDATWTPGDRVEESFIAVFDRGGGGAYTIMAPAQTMVSGRAIYIFDVSAYGNFNALAANLGNNNDTAGSVVLHSVKAEGDSTAPTFSGGFDCTP